MIQSEFRLGSGGPFAGASDWKGCLVVAAAVTSRGAQTESVDGFERGRDDRTN
ncbi:MAG: hypothetical protein J07HX5_01334 [halophilic archaeon J07HX5]|nr:MAG: hypothetical protein J07HX5_01334 [halophilic archaeon J07HX5]